LRRKTSSSASGATNEQGGRQHRRQLAVVQVVPQAAGVGAGCCLQQEPLVGVLVPCGASKVLLLPRLPTLPPTPLASWQQQQQL